jgi:acyl-CoA thioester hydrolase
MTTYSTKMSAGWADMDFHSHMRGAAFLDKACDARLMFLAGHGYPMNELLRLHLGTVAMKDEIEYYRDVALHQDITVTLSLGGMAPDGSRWRLRHEMLRGDGKICARVTCIGGWLDLAERKLVAPPAGLVAALKSLSPTSDYTELRSTLERSQPPGANPPVATG